jgi:hypothetical protein
MPASGKRRARSSSSLHDAAARSLVVLLFACMSAGAALLGAPLLALLGGFVAVSLAINFIFPVAGFLRIDAQHAFQRLVWQRRREALRKRRPWRRDHRGLELLPSQLEERASRRHLGIQPIPLDSIIGTTEPQKAASFDHAFRPPTWSRGRWELVWMARRRGGALPPISVYRLHGRHYVIDGHHRVSVERSLRAASIDADVTVLAPLAVNPGAPNHLPTSPPRKAWGPRGSRAVLLFLAGGLALTLLSGALGEVAGYVLIIGACALVGRGLGIPVQAGLKDYRQ